MIPPIQAIDSVKTRLASGDHGAALALLLPLRHQYLTDATVATLVADAHHLAGKLDDAVAAYRTAVALGGGAAWFGLGCALLKQRAFGAAADALARSARSGGGAAARHNLGTALFELGRVDAAVESFRIAERADDPAVAALARRALAGVIPGAASADHAAVLAARQSWASRLSHPPTATKHPHGGPKKRIGYMSAFFGARNWMKPVWGVINHHDRARFDIHLFSDGADPSEASGYRDHDADHIHEIRHLDHAQAARAIADARIDVLVDLNGYSHQDRLAVMLARPAPVLVGWFNMFASTGIAAFDWLVGDAAVIRPEEEVFYPERVHRVPGSYLAFDVAYPTPDVTAPPCAASGKITFGCLGSQYKITDDAIVAWGDILRAAPEALLFVKNAALSDGSTRDDLLGRLAAVGIAGPRITLDGRSEHFSFLDAYRHVDVALDTFPYNGGTTTTEALWQGVPVLTFCGDRWASRTSASLLRAAGLDAWVCPDRDATVRHASALATSPDTPAMLAQLRQGMRDRLTASPVCDTAGLCGALESFYERIAHA